MAGRALRKRILADIAKQGGADYLFDQLASGKTLTKLAAGYECSREYLSKSIHAIPEYASAVTKARQSAADALVEEGLDMVDSLGASSTTSEISATREKVQWRKFMAGSYNHMHLDALRKVNSDLAGIDAEDRKREALAVDVDYEDVTDD